MKFFVFLALSFLLAACQNKVSTGPSGQPVVTPSPVLQFACSAEKALDNSIAGGIATALSCSHPDVIAADLLKLMGKANVCTTYSSAKTKLASMKKNSTAPGKEGKDSVANDKAYIGALVCPPLVNAFGEEFTSALKPEWGCAPGVTVSAAEVALQGLCIGAVPL